MFRGVFMTTEPVIIPPANFTDEDIVAWMKDKLSSVDHLLELYAKRGELVADLSKLDDEIDEYRIKSAIQTQRK